MTPILELRSVTKRFIRLYFGADKLRTGTWVHHGVYWT